MMCIQYSHLLHLLILLHLLLMKLMQMTPKYSHLLVTPHTTRRSRPPLSTGIL
jgi:hypothetical protein